jgi:hypothetical protein
MNQQKDLLYYINARVMTTPCNGAPVKHFNFFRVKTGELISLGTCIHNEIMEEITGQKYYKDITSAIENYDILWEISDNDVKRLNEPFENVQKEYYKMLDEGAKESVARNFLIDEYNNEQSLCK